VRSGIQRPKGREVARQVRMHQMEHVLGFQQVPQSVFAEIPQLDAHRKDTAGQLLHGLGQEDLATVAGVEEPGQPVEWRREIVTTSVRDRFPGVQGHAHPEFTNDAPVFSQEGALSS
jgi:hypothetical protein